MTRFYLLLALLFLHYIAIFGQSKEKFKFTQIDSIVDSNIVKLRKGSFVIVHQVWYVGSRISDKKKDLYYRNPFELIFYYKQNRHSYAKKIDNMGESKYKIFLHSDLRKFLDNNFSLMLNERLTPKIDTIGFKTDTTATGEIRTSYTTEQTTIDHQRTDKVWIYFKGQNMSFDFLYEYEDNKWNHNKKQYLFLKLLQQKSNTISKKLKTY